jgi:hypothetical protein
MQRKSTSSHRKKIYTLPILSMSNIISKYGPASATNQHSAYLYPYPLVDQRTRQTRRQTCRIHLYRRHVFLDAYTVPHMLDPCDAALPTITARLAHVQTAHQAQPGTWSSSSHPFADHLLAWCGFQPVKWQPRVIGMQCKRGRKEAFILHLEIEDHGRWMYGEGCAAVFSCCCQIVAACDACVQARWTRQGERGCCC